MGSEPWAVVHRWFNAMTSDLNPAEIGVETHFGVIPKHALARHYAKILGIVSV